MEATLVLLTEHRFGFTSAQNGWMFAYIGLVIVFMQGGMIGRLSKKYGERRLICLGLLMAALGLSLIPLFKSPCLLYGALALLGVGSGMYTPANQSILSKLAAQSQVGGVMGVGESLSALGRILGPIAGRFSFQYLGMSMPYVVGGIAMALAFAISFTLPQIIEKVEAYQKHSLANSLAASS